MHSAVIYYFSLGSFGGFYSHYITKAKHGSMGSQGHRPAYSCTASSPDVLTLHSRGWKCFGLTRLQ